VSLEILSQYKSLCNVYAKLDTIAIGSEFDYTASALNATHGNCHNQRQDRGVVHSETLNN
jgi:hypothetical protein